MARCRRWFGVLVLSFGLGGVGCAGDASNTLSQRPPGNAQEVPPPTDPPRTPIARYQREDSENPVVAKAAPLAQATPPPPTTILDGVRPQGTVRLCVRAWVNDRPIFDNDVERNTYGNNSNYLTGLKQQIQAHPQVASFHAQFAKEYRRLYDAELKRLIDTELAYQDALKKLEANTKMLDKLKAAAAKEFDKQLARMMKATGKESLEEFKYLVSQQGSSYENLRSNAERDFISKEYMRSLIGSSVLKVGQTEVREWYDQHANEFQTVDSVKWQDIFILGDNHPTPGGARRVAEELLARVQSGEDFEKLLKYDEGDSWRYRKGDGFGRLKGEIRPRELESYLFRMKDGEPGPLVETASGTGVHLFRLVRREFAGLKPFDEKIQLEILMKLRNEVANRESQRIIQELRDRSVIVIEPMGGL